MDRLFEQPITKTEFLADTKAMLIEDPQLFADAGITVDPDSVTTYGKPILFATYSEHEYMLNKCWCQFPFEKKNIAYIIYTCWCHSVTVDPLSVTTYGET